MGCGFLASHLKSYRDPTSYIWGGRLEYKLQSLSYRFLGDILPEQPKTRGDYFRRSIRLASVATPARPAKERHFHSIADNDSTWHSLRDVLASTSLAFPGEMVFRSSISIPVRNLPPGPLGCCIFIHILMCILRVSTFRRLSFSASRPFVTVSNPVHIVSD